MNRFQPVTVVSAWLVASAVCLIVPSLAIDKIFYAFGDICDPARRRWCWLTSYRSSLVAGT